MCKNAGFYRVDWNEADALLERMQELQQFRERGGVSVNEGGLHACVVFLPKGQQIVRRNYTYELRRMPAVVDAPYGIEYAAVPHQ